MFTKIRDKLKDVFEKSSDVIEDDLEGLEEVEDVNQDLSFVEENDVEVEIKEEEEKRSFLSKVFSKKKNDLEELKDIEDVQENLLEGVEQEEVEAIKNKQDLPDDVVERNKEELQVKELTEQENEKELVEDIDELQEKKGFFSKTAEKLKSKKITMDDFDRIWVELEIFLLEINIAYEIVEKIEIKLRDELIDNSFNRFKLSKKIREVLIEEVEFVLKDHEADFIKRIRDIRDLGQVAKVLVLGVNGTGKTTSTAKVISYLQKQNLRVVLAASDTYRAAAVEQLETHANNLGVKMIKHKNGSDPAAVAFDAVEHAKAKDVDVVLIDTAGRMPNNSNLMLELQKIKKVSEAQIAIFIGDSVSGNDLVEQIDLFDKGVEIDGVILTKVDIDERPGSVVTCAYSIDKPIYFLGIGQNYDDLVKFDSKDVAEKLFSVEAEE